MEHMLLMPSQMCREIENISQCPLFMLIWDIFFILGQTGSAQELLLALQSGWARETVWDVQDGTCADHV